MKHGCTTSKDIRRFRVRIPGGFLSPVNPSTRWPNGKAPDYGAIVLHLLLPHQIGTYETFTEIQCNFIMNDYVF